MTRPSVAVAPARAHLVDGTYELFRHFFGQPARSADDGAEIGAARGVVTSIVGLLKSSPAGLRAEEIRANWRVARRFEPAMSRDRAAELRAGWEKAVSRAKEWA